MNARAGRRRPDDPTNHYIFSPHYGPGCARGVAGVVGSAGANERGKEDGEVTSKEKTEIVSALHKFIVRASEKDAMSYEVMELAAVVNALVSLCQLPVSPS